MSPLVGTQRTLIVKALVSSFNKEKALARAFSGHCATSRRFVDSPASASAPFLQSPTTSVWEHFTNHGNHWHRISAEHCQHGPELGAHFTSYFPHSLTHTHCRWMMNGTVYQTFQKYFQCFLRKILRYVPPFCSKSINGESMISF